jgi:polar amino acid transport system substrate-binding protein
MAHPLLFALLCFATGSLQAQTVVRATGHPNWPPFSWQQGDRIIGIGTELTEIVFKELGMTVSSTALGNWKRAQWQVEHGKADVIVAAYLTTERNKFMLYPAQPYMNDANVLWVAKDNVFTFRQWSDLIGRTGTAMLGESYGEGFDLYIKEKLKIDWVNTPAQSLGKLELGRADYYPFSLYGGQIQVRQLGFEDKITYLPNVLSTEGTYIAISRKSQLIKHLPQIEAIIARLRADGTVDRLVKKYIDLASRPSAQPNLGQ